MKNTIKTPPRNNPEKYANFKRSLHFLLSFSPTAFAESVFNARFIPKEIQ